VSEGATFTGDIFDAVGALEGVFVGETVVGRSVGDCEGVRVGLCDGLRVGIGEGDKVGDDDNWHFRPPSISM